MDQESETKAPEVAEAVKAEEVDDAKPDEADIEETKVLATDGEATLQDEHEAASTDLVQAKDETSLDEQLESAGKLNTVKALTEDENSVITQLKETGDDLAYVEEQKSVTDQQEESKV